MVGYSRESIGQKNVYVLLVWLHGGLPLVFRYVYVLLVWLHGGLPLVFSIKFFQYVEHLARNVNTSETRSWFDQTFPTASSVFAATPSRHTATPSLGNRVHWVGALYIVWGVLYNVWSVVYCAWAFYLVWKLCILCGTLIKRCPEDPIIKLHTCALVGAFGS